MAKHALIFANGAVQDGYFVQQALQLTPQATIVAADGGANLAHDQFDIVPHIVIGDMDSVHPDLLNRLAIGGTEVVRYPAEKNETDLELALLWAAEQYITDIHVIGGLGRRIDQTLGNIYLLTLPALASAQTRLVDGDQQMWVAAPGETCIEGQAGDTLSLIPISGDVCGIHTQNLYYPLENETLRFGPARGMSNVLTASQANVAHTDGLLFIVQTRGRAE